MKKLALLFLLPLSVLAQAYWDYPLFDRGHLAVNPSSNYYEFESELRKDYTVLNELKNTGMISYLLFEDNKIVIDEQDIPDYTENGDRIHRYLPSHSMGKSLVSYVTGHAICNGHISSVDEKLDWDLIDNTLYDDQRLIDLLNMQAGDQVFVGSYQYPQNDNLLKYENINGNLYGLEWIMNETSMVGSKKSRRVYNYSALTTHVIFNYVLHKSGEDILDEVFNKHVGIENNVYFEKSHKGYGYNNIDSARYSFYADRYDYLRIARTIMNDWNSDTCIGDYLRTIHNRRIAKGGDRNNPSGVFSYSTHYGGQIHFDVRGKSQTILGLDGFAGQQILINVDDERIVVLNALYHGRGKPKYDWEQLVYRKI